MSLVTLPNELIHHICSFLHPQWVEHLAFTFKSSITDVCIRVLAPVFVERRKEKRMLEKFGPMTDETVWLKRHKIERIFNFEPDELLKDAFPMGITESPGSDALDFNSDDDLPSDGFNLADDGPPVHGDPDNCQSPSPGQQHPDKHHECDTHCCVSDDDDYELNDWSRIYLRTNNQLTYLELDGSLSWLQAPDPITLTQMTPPPANTIMETDIEDLIATASRVGVRFPPGFLALLSSDLLTSYMPSYVGSVFSLEGSKLLKCAKTLDGGVGGYMVRFYGRNDYGWANWILYIEPEDKGGAHCILNTLMRLDLVEFGNCRDSDDSELHDLQHDDWTKYALLVGILTDDEADEANRLSVVFVQGRTRDTSLHGTNFERWLADVYFSQWLILAVKNRSKACRALDRLKEYVKDVYVSPPSN